MGFYECIYDCGDNCYCVSIDTTIDIDSQPSYILCAKHKNNKSIIKCDIYNFMRRYSKTPRHIYTTLNIIDRKNKFVKCEL